MVIILNAWDCEYYICLKVAGQTGRCVQQVICCMVDYNLIVHNGNTSQYLWLRWAWANLKLVRCIVHKCVLFLLACFVVIYLDDRI